MRRGWVSILAEKFPKGVTGDAPGHPAFLGIFDEVPLGISQFLLAFGGDPELIDIQRR